MTPTAVLALLFAVCSWGSMFLVAKPVLALLDPLWFTVLRYLLASLGFAVLLGISARRPSTEPGPGLRAAWRAHWPRLTALGLAGYGFFSVLTLAGLSLSLPSHGAVLMATMPLTTLLLRWMLDGQRPAPRVLGAALLALGGVVMVSGVLGGAGGGSGQGPAGRLLLGDALTLLGTLGWVLYTRGATRLPQFSPLQFTALTALSALPWLLGLALLAAGLHWLPAPRWQDLAPAALPLLYIAAVPTVAAVLAFNFGVRRLGAARATLFLNGVPVSALLLSVLLGQHPSAQEWLGALLVIGALSLSNGGTAAPARGGLSSRRTTPACRSAPRPPGKGLASAVRWRWRAAAARSAIAAGRGRGR